MQTEIYLKQPCAMTGRPYETLNLEDFKTLGGERLINEKFFSLPEVDVSTTVNPAQMEALSKLEFGVNLEHLEQIVASARADWELRVRREVEAREALLNNLICLKEARERKTNPLLAQVKNILAEGKWKLLRVSAVEDQIIFAQTQDVIMPWKNEALGVDYKVNLGKFKVEIVPSTRKVRIYPHEGNLYAKGYFHPHVKGSGWVCWGNASHMVDTAKEAGDLKGILDVCEVFLNEYNPASPYADYMEWLGNEWKKNQEAPAGTLGAIPAWMEALSVRDELRQYHDARVMVIDGHYADGPEQYISLHRDATAHQVIHEVGIERWGRRYLNKNWYPVFVRGDEDEATVFVLNVNREWVEVSQAAVYTNWDEVTDEWPEETNEDE